MENNEKKINIFSRENPHRVANIIVVAVVSLAALILIAIGVLCAVDIDPTHDMEKPSYYNLYDLNSEERISSNTEVQSRIGVAVGDMKFSVMSAILQSHWNYSYQFKRNSSGERIELSASDIAHIGATSDEYMVELVYPTVGIKDGEIDYASAKSIKVDGETVYFDRVKMLIGNTDGKVGTISLYPYLSVRLDNQSDIPEIASDSYTITGVNIRANTSSAYNALKSLIADMKADTVGSASE